VIICCYNSASRIKPTLEHISKQVIPGSISWEVVLIDNNCTDNTVEVAQHTWRSTGEHLPSLRIVREPRPGLSFARMAGINSAEFEILCFCDDDNWLSENYLNNAYKIMQENSSIGILAGQGIAVSNVPIPKWFKDVEANYACGKLAEKDGDVSFRKAVWGAGMILRKSYFLKLIQAGFEHLSPDRVGNILSSGGDTEICFWHTLTGKKIWYDSSLVFNHFISESRLNVEVSRELENGHNQSLQQLSPYFPLIYPQKDKRKKSISLFFRTAIKALRGIDDQEAFLLYQSFFNSRINKKTIKILESIERFKRL
jgi:glycosyltransferase involved in cell wall biosynthesis